MPRAKPLALILPMLAGVAATFGATERASANGRFPVASQLVVDPRDGNHLFARTTYGMIQSTDGGATWRWLCEKAVGYGGVIDPAIGVTSDGTLLAAVFDGLAVSHDRACSWAFAAGVLEKEYVIDVAIEPKTPSHAVAMTSTGRADAGIFVVVAETLDDGRTWTQTGAQLPTDLTAETIDVAPSDPQRLYVSGVFGSPATAAIERSDDRGAHWTRTTIPLAGRFSPYIAAVDPMRPDRLYVRIDFDGGDTLMVSDDGAANFKAIATTVGDMLSFALSPDGTRLAFGGPKDGIYVGSTTDFVFTKKTQLATRCMTWTSAGLYSCASEYPDGFTIGVSTDEAKTFTGLYHLSALSQLVCPSDTSVGRICPAYWESTAATLGIDTSDAGPGDAGDAGDAAAIDADAATDASDRRKRQDESASCGCSVPGRAGGDAALGILTIAASMALGVFLAKRPRAR